MKDMTGTLVWANSAPAGTVVTEVSTEAAQISGIAVVHIHNPSTITALTITLVVRWTDSAGNSRDSVLTTLSVPANSTRAFVVQGFGLGTSVLKASNDTVLGVAQGFTAFYRVEFDF